jgi:hypothetical protein
MVEPVVHDSPALISTPCDLDLRTDEQPESYGGADRNHDERDVQESSGQSPCSSYDRPFPIEAATFSGLPALSTSPTRSRRKMTMCPTTANATITAGSHT